MITRIYLSGSYLPPPGEKDKRMSRWDSSGVRTDQSILYKAQSPVLQLLGAPDILAIGTDRPMCRCRLPYFSDVADTSAGASQCVDEPFPTFFARRELSLPIYFGKDRQPKADKGILAALSITLKQRDLRLFFIHRLLRAFDQRDNNQQDRTRFDIPLESAGAMIDPIDRAVLGEGWGDVVLLFSWPDKEDQETVEERMLDIFRLDTILSRTFKLIAPSYPGNGLSALCGGIRKVLDHGQIRLMEDRMLSLAASSSPRAYRKG